MGDDFVTSEYGAVFAAAIDSAPPAALDSGEPGAHASVSDMNADRAFAHTTVRDAGMADCCLAGVWLLHNDLDRAHTLCQDVPTASGSYWHGVVHRREGDFGNAGYWFARCANHPVIEPIAAAVNEDPVAGPVFSGNWSPEAMIDRCRLAVRGDDSLVEGCLAAQRIEWRLLFSSCYRSAVR